MSHRIDRTTEYRIWAQMIGRCENKANDAYKWYGARGISVCSRWRASFKVFLADMGYRPKDRTLDRINNNGNYEPANCRWATKSEQRLNSRQTVICYEYLGKTQCMAAWAKEFGLPVNLVHWRLRTAKWEIERALTTPSKRQST